jgi:putative tryptophan/tyrosine transport system substrate-binding protein
VESGDHQVAGLGYGGGTEPWTAAFVQRLREPGWTEGGNVAIEYRWGEGRTERFTELQASSHKPAAVDHQN